MPRIQIRNKRGHLQRGHSFGTTSEAAKRRNNIEAAFDKAITPADFYEIARGLRDMALGIDADPHDKRLTFDARKYVCDRLMGKPKQQVDVEVTQNRADSTVVYQQFVKVFGLENVAPQAKPTEAAEQFEGEVIDNPVSDGAERCSLPTGAGTARPLLNPPALPEALDRGPGDVQDCGEGPAVGVHLDRGPVVSPPPADHQD